MPEVKTKKYEDITEEWLKLVNTNNNGIITLQGYYEHKGVKYFVDGKYVVFNPSHTELEVAELLVNNLGGSITILPRVNEPEGIKTPDYLYNNERWDLKIISGDSKTVLYSSVRKHEKQAHNFIFDITKTSLSLVEIEEQIKYIYRRLDLIWLDTVIIIKDKEIIAVYKSKQKK